METLSYMLAGYLVIWALAFGFVFSIWARSRRLEQEVAELRRLVEKLEQKEA
jgi:hypothetical protein